MAFANSDGVKIWWDEQGTSPGCMEPVLLIMGLGCPSYSWYRTQPALAAHYRTIAFDNRGIGRSDAPPGPYTIAGMAADAAAVLDAAQVASAHVFGLSMGGMIAQEFALQYPHRVRSLILGCTAAGGPEAVRSDPETTRMLMARDFANVEEAAEAAVPFLYHPATPRQCIDEDIAVRRPWFPTPEAYQSQLQAIFTWESCSRIARIKAPTLVVHGDSDRLVPLGNGQLLAERIPCARLVIVRNACHMFTTDQPEEANRVILEFLDAQSSQAGAGA